LVRTLPCEVRSQIAQAERIAIDRRAREERAAMAVLPLALSALSQYSRDCILYLSLLILSEGEEGSYPKLPIGSEAPRIPDDVTAPLQLCARFAEPENVEKIEKALTKLQIQNSRLLRWLTKHRGEEIGGLARLEGLSCMRDAADLHSAVDDLFRYARNEKLLRQYASIQELTSALHNVGLWDNSHPIFEFIDPGSPNDDQPKT
jgi:hypothetical protein